MKLLIYPICCLGSIWIVIGLSMAAKMADEKREQMLRQRRERP